jgi:integrase
MKRTNHGLRKRCDCPRREWPRCSHSWHLNFAWRGTHFRLSIDRETHKHVETKADALAAADHLRDAIRAGTFRQVTAPAVEAGLTFGDVATKYVKQYVRVATRRKRAAAEMALQVAALRRAEVPAANGRTVRLEEKPVDAILKGDVEAIREDRRAAMATSKAAWEQLQAVEAETVDPKDAEAVAAHAARVAALRPTARLARQSVKGGEVGTNRLLTRLHHLLHWAIDAGFATRTPFTRDGSQTGRTVITRNMQAESHRRRRLDGDEERRLLDAAGPHLRAMIEAALETGCRKGELLSLQWAEVSLAHGVIVLPAEKTKTAETRTIPVTSRLDAILKMRQTAPDGKDHKPTAYVFGNEVGEEVKSIKTAWRLTCRRAGIANLHFHDLRREFGSRLLETPGTSLHEVQSWLGHATAVQTSTYLATTVTKLQATARRFEMARRDCTNLAQNDESAPEPASETPSNLPANSLH